MINTGTAPTVPDLPGVAEAMVWTSETILQLERIPRRLLILGGGYVGCEFASMLAIFGSQVTMLQGPSQLLPREDPMSLPRWPTSLLTKESSCDSVHGPRLSIVILAAKSS